MKILALDTSGPVASCALAEDKKLIAGFRLQCGLTHSQTIMPLVENMRTLTGFSMDEVDYIAVAAGPGSFTGLRIGAGCVKGLSFARDIPVIPVPTIEAMAYQLTGCAGLVCPMLDARRDQVYSGIFRFVPEKQKNRKTSDQCNINKAEAGGENSESGETHEITYRMETLLEQCAIPVEELVEKLNGYIEQSEGKWISEEPGDSAEDVSGQSVVHLMGDGVPVYAEMMKKLLRVHFTFVPFHRDRQSAESVAAYAFILAEEGKAVKAGDFVPDYIRPFISGPKP